MSYLSAHVLDAAAGRPAAGVSIQLADSAGTLIAESITDFDGRTGDLGPDRLPAGEYQVRFATGEYFAGRGVECFHPSVSVVFTARKSQPHYHIPLLLSPYAYTTYRGS